MDSKPKQWSTLAEFLLSEKLSEYIPTFSTLNLLAFSKLTKDDIDRQVSPTFDRKRILDAVYFSRAYLESTKGTHGDKEHLRKSSHNKNGQPHDLQKTPTKTIKVASSIPNKNYLSAITKSLLRPTKSLSPPMKPKHKMTGLVPYSEESSEGSDQEETNATGEDGEGSNLLRLRRTLGSSDPSISSADKTGETNEIATFHRSRASSRRATEYRLSAGEFSPCHSPCPSPRALSPNRPPPLPVNLVSLNYTRRWSVASSDYFSGSPSSLSSASSQERLSQYPGYRASDEDVSHQQLTRQHSQPDCKNRHRLRARSLSPERPPEGNIAAATSFNIYKDRFPQAKVEMERKLDAFIEVSRERGKGEVKGEANVNFIHHRVIELAKDILSKSMEGRITDTYFEEVSTTLVKLMMDSERTANNAVINDLMTNSAVVTKEASELLKIISRSARLLECLTFSVGSFYSQVNDGTIDELLKSTASLPRYISSRLSTKFGVIESGDEPPSPSTAHPSSSGTEDEGMDRPNQFKEEDFEVRKLISNGAYGEVFLVKHVESKELFALKRIRKDRVIERSEVERAFMERDILSFVQNPFVVSMLCSFQTKTHLCMVLEYVEGGDVGTLLANIGMLELELARMYHAETVLALEYIHSYGIVHRDLKPENLLITKEGHIKLTDFGLSKCGLMQMATRTYENSMAAFDQEVGCTGTPDYIAPEVLYSRQYGFSVDWWSMGIILYQFLVGVTPFHGDTIQTLFESINPRNIEWPDDEPVDLDAKDLILSLLFMDPSQRLGAQGAQEVKKHPFYYMVQWDEVIMHKAEFIPYLDSDEDTSYFDTRTDRYDHSISEDYLPSLEDSANHIKYFDSVNWSSAEQFIALNSPRNRHLSHDSVDSGTDNQPSISTDDGHSSSGDQPHHFHTSTPRERCSSDSVLRPVKEEQIPTRQTKTPDGLTTSTPTKRSPTNSTTLEFIKSLCTPVKIKPPPQEATTQKSEVEQPEKIEEDETEEEEEEEMQVTPNVTPTKSPVKKLDLSVLQKFQEIELPEEDEEDEEGEDGGEHTLIVHKGKLGYGFVLNAIKVVSTSSGGVPKYSIKHLVADVHPNGAAADAGLKKDDLIVGVNGTPAEPLTHQQLVEIIKDSGHQLELKVIPLSKTSIQTRRSTNKKGKKKKRQSSFFKKATHAGGHHSSLSMEKFLHLSRSKTRDKQNSDSDKSGGEQDALMIHGHNMFTSTDSEPDPILKQKLFRPKFNRRRPSSNFIAPVSPLARTPSPTGHCYFAPDSDRKTPRSSAAQKTLHVTHPRTQSLSSVTKRPEPNKASSPASKRKIISPSLHRKSTLTHSSDSPAPDNLPSPSAVRGDHLLPSPSAVRGDHLLPLTRERRRSWVQGVEDRNSL